MKTLWIVYSERFFLWAFQVAVFLLKSRSTHLIRLGRVMHRDAIYQCSHDLVENFKFDDRVVAVFQDMIKRSVPGYGMVLSLVNVLAEHYLQASSQAYDLGCSLCASSLAMSTVAVKRACRIIAVDSSPSMIEQAKKNFAGLSLDCKIDCFCDDIRQISIEKASMVTMNFTLQFVPPEDRQAMIESIYQGLLPNGVLMLSEKIKGETAQSDACLYALHHEFKRANGYTQLEISQKRSALEEVMITETLSQHKQRLLLAGFSRVECVFQALNFVSLLAIK